MRTVTRAFMKKLGVLWQNHIDEATAMQLSATKEVAHRLGRITVANARGDANCYGALDWRGEAEGEGFLHTEDDVLPASIDDFYVDAFNRRRSLYNTLPSPPFLKLKVGVPVIFTQNIRNLDVVNGTTGTVFCFRTPGHGLEDEEASDWELPFGIDADMVAQYWDQINGASVWPMIEYTDSKGELRWEYIKPCMFTKEDQNGTVMCSRMQLPLMVSSALTIHRAQGLTIKRLIINVAGIFTHGQLYTALSRAPDFQHVQLVGGFRSGEPLAHKDVIDFEENTCWIDVDNGP